jgi:folylpolyglutamate synthase/dihydropteroate synthase
MSLIGNIAAAQSAKAIGKYNEAVVYQQAKYERKKAAVREKVYNTIERPRFVKAQERAMANFRISALRSGAEYRDGTTPFLVGVENIQNQLFDLSLADYNNEVLVNDQINQSLLLEARGRGERLKGDLTARAEYMKAAGSLLTMSYKSNQAGSLVIV